MEYSYDQLLRLTGVTGNQTQAGGVLGTRTYDYDSRGNRWREILEDTSFSYTLVFPQSPPNVDHLESTGRSTYFYDALGRAFLKRGAVKDSSGLFATEWRFDYWPSNTWGPLGDVFRSVSLYSGPSASPSTYSYYYDGFNRRRLKVYPTNVQDEYFYGAGKELLEDRGAYSLSAASPYPVDEYIWLDGRPVAFIRSKHTLNGDAWVREPGWGSGTCQRNGEAMPCGAYFIVTDHIGKPVLVLDSNRKVAGVADYDPFGFPNRAFLKGETAHPYANDVSGQVLTTMSQPQTSGVQMDARVLFQAVDTEGVSWDYAYLANSSGTDLGTHVGGWHQGRLSTGWVPVPSDGKIDVSFRSDSSNYCIDPSTSGISCPGGTCSYCPSSNASCSCPDFPYWGVALEGYEYRRYQAGAAPAWTPLRFPGQYYDAETELFENWNRYYDPSVGRYLQPDPVNLGTLFIEYPPDEKPEEFAPRYMQFMYQGERHNPYAYAMNNPLAYADPDGKNPAAAAAAAGAFCSTRPNVCQAAADAAVKAAATVAAAAVAVYAYCAAKDAGTCSCQHRDVFTSGGESCQSLRERGICVGPYSGSGTDQASCQASARANAPAACRGCLGHCQYKGR